MQRCARPSRERRSKAHDNGGRRGEGRERRRSTTSNEGRREEGRGELAGCLGVQLTIGPEAFVAGAGQAGGKMNPTKGSASRQTRTCIDSSKTAASLTVRPGCSYPEAGCNADRTTRLPRHCLDQLSILSELFVDFEGFCGTGKPRENLWATSRPDQNQALSSKPLITSQTPAGFVTLFFFRRETHSLTLSVQRTLCKPLATALLL